MKKGFLNSFKYAIQGIIAAFKEEKNMKIHVIIMILVIIAGILVKISVTEWIICIILFAMIIGAEMFNTTIEKIVDVIIPEKSDKAKIIKDIAAGAVLINAIASVVVGIIIFIPKILK